MSKKENQQYPVKTTHEFLTEMNRQWGRFKLGAILSTIISALLLIGFVLFFLRVSRFNGFELSDLILILMLAGFLSYTIYLTTSQYRFFRKWETRLKRIYSYEEKLLAEDEST